MTQIKVENIEKAIEKIDTLEADALDKLIETFTLKQENLVDYVLQAGLEYENDSLNSYSIYYFAIAMESFLESGVKMKLIDEDDIENFQEPFLLCLDAIHEDEDYSPMHELIQQNSLIQFILNDIEAEDEEGVSLDEDTKTQLFIVCSSMLGLMNASITK